MNLPAEPLRVGRRASRTPGGPDTLRHVFGLHGQDRSYGRGALAGCRLVQVGPVGSAHSVHEEC
jgi:hypothetical protein